MKRLKMKHVSHLFVRSLRTVIFPVSMCVELQASCCADVAGKAC